MTRGALLLALSLVAFSGCGERDKGGSVQGPPTTVTPPTTTIAAPTTIPAPPSQAPPPPSLPEVPVPLTKRQLHDLVAPVALYPDVVLTSLLPATTFPAQVADAAAWPQSQGGQVDQAPSDRNWDGSVSALLQFPDLLDWLDINYAWAGQVGTAVIYNSIRCR